MGVPSGRSVTSYVVALPSYPAAAVGVSPSTEMSTSYPVALSTAGQLKDTLVVVLSQAGNGAVNGCAMATAAVFSAIHPF